MLADFRGSIVTFFPQIINLLKDDIVWIRMTSVFVLSKLSKHGM